MKLMMSYCWVSGAEKCWTQIGIRIFWHSCERLPFSCHVLSLRCLSEANLVPFPTAERASPAPHGPLWASGKTNLELKHAGITWGLGCLGAMPSQSLRRANPVKSPSVSVGGPPKGGQRGIHVQALNHVESIFRSSSSPQDFRRSHLF